MFQICAILQNITLAPDRPMVIYHFTEVASNLEANSSLSNTILPPSAEESYRVRWFGAYSAAHKIQRFLHSCSKHQSSCIRVACQRGLGLRACCHPFKGLLLSLRTFVSSRVARMPTKTRWARKSKLYTLRESRRGTC